MASSLEKARVSLILNEPFFASIALKMDFVASPEQEAMKTDGRKILYNPKMFESLRPEERTGIIAHTVMHVAMMHHLRVHGRDEKLWNKACDFAINPLLKKSNIFVPSDAQMSQRFDGENAESIYEILKQEQQEQQQQNSGGGQGEGQGQPDYKPYGDVMQPPQGSDIKELEQEVREMVVEAHNAAKQAGKLPSFVKELMEDVVEPKQPWKEILQRFVSSLAKNDYSWVRPNPRYLPSGMYLPALHSEEIGGIVFAIDTSGSISNKLLMEFVSEIRDAASIMKVPVTVIQCDTQVQKVFEMDEDDSKFKFKGRGGTAFQPVFNYVTQNLPDTKAIVYFTDGEAFDNYKEPFCPVLWAIYDNRRFNAKFGEVVIVQP